MSGVWNILKPDWFPAEELVAVYNMHEYNAACRLVLINLTHHPECCCKQCPTPERMGWALEIRRQIQPPLRQQPLQQLPDWPEWLKNYCRQLSKSYFNDRIDCTVSYLNKLKLKNYRNEWARDIWELDYLNPERARLR